MTEEAILNYRRARGQTYFLSLILILLIFLSAEVRADIYYDFAVVENDLAASMAEQLSVEVTSYGSDQVLFTFSNTPTLYSVLSSSITDIYFEDGTLFGIAGIIESVPDVDFGVGASPPNVSGWSTEDDPFNMTHGFSTDSEPPVMSSGVELGESVGIYFDLIDGKTFSDVIAALDQGFLDPTAAEVDSLRIALRVQAIEGLGWNDSASFILTGVGIEPQVVPLPGAVLLGMLGLSVAGIKLRKYA